MYAKQVLLASFNYLKQKINILNVRAKNGRQDKMKATGRDGIPVELFQILKDDAVKVLHSIYQQIWKTQQRLQDWTRPVFIPIPKNVQSTVPLLLLLSHFSHVRLCATP